jgi:hypothetical protein
LSNSARLNPSDPFDFLNDDEKLCEMPLVADVLPPPPLLELLEDVLPMVIKFLCEREGR